MPFTLCTALILSATGSAGLEGLWGDLSAGGAAKAAEKVTDDATVTVSFGSEPGASEPTMPDAVYKGRDEVGQLLADLASGFQAAAGADGTVGLSCDRFRRMGLEGVHFQVADELVDGRVRSLRLTVIPAEAAAVRIALVAWERSAVYRFFDALNHRDYTIFQELGSPDFVQHSSMPVGPGIGGVQDFYRTFQTAFPDFRFTLEDVVPSGDKVAARITARFTHRGEYMGVAATGKPVVLLKMDLFRFRLGRIVEHWDVVDRLGLLQQLGAIPRLPRWGWTPGDPGFR